MRISRLPKSSAPVKSGADQPVLSNLLVNAEDDFGMGVLEDGTPFLTQRGLALMCGVQNAHIGTISSQWSDEVEKPRVRKIREILAARGIELDSPHLSVQKSGRRYFAYSEAVCLAIIEYYAFEAASQCQTEALSNYRKLTKIGFRDFVYQAIGYRPASGVGDCWKPFYDRVSLTYNATPEGYFSIFREIAELLICCGESGIATDESFVPDISVGKGWSEHWQTADCEIRFGPRRTYQHHYPEYFPQAASNPQHPWCYPDEALGEFRRWFRSAYLRGGKFQKYLEGQVRKGVVAAFIADQALAAYGLEGVSGPAAVKRLSSS